jgi:hypothetical protein
MVDRERKERGRSRGRGKVSGPARPLGPAKVASTAKSRGDESEARKL